MFYSKEQKHGAMFFLYYFDIIMINTVTKILPAMWELCWWKLYDLRFWGHVKEKHKLSNLNKFKTK